MKINQLGKITNIKVPGTIFASENSGTFLELSNEQQLTFIVESGEGAAGSTNVTVEAKSGADGTAAAVPFLYMEKGDSEYTEKETAAFAIGGAAGESRYALVTVTSDMLAKNGYDRAAIKTSAVEASTVNGSIMVIQTQPRYSE